jgi:hypothetical protein
MSSSSRHRAKLRHKFKKARLRQCGFMKVKKNGGRMKTVKRHGNRKTF